MNIVKFFLDGLGNWYANKTLITEAIVLADKLGFDGTLMPDHYMWGDRQSRSKRPDDYSTLETWTTLTYLAGKTERIRLGTLVTPIPFRPPGMLAKMLSTLDILSEGRVILGVGAGWSQDEFDGYSIWGGAKYRVDKTIEGLKLIIDLWTKDNVDFKGRFYEAKGAVLDPKPVQKPYPKLLFGSMGDRMLSLTGRYGDICFIPPWSGESHGDIKAKVLEAAKKAGRADKIEFMVGTMGGMAPYDSSAHSRNVEAAAEDGAGIYLVGFPRDDAFLISMQKFADEVMPSYA